MGSSYKLVKTFSWSDATWEELQQRAADSSTVCLLPIGATEQHGPHLGTGVDGIVAEKISAAAAEKCGALQMPLLPYGCSLGHTHHWPGTLALTPRLLSELVEQIVEWAYVAGFRRFLFVNGHVTNAAPLRCALETLRYRHAEGMFAVINLAQISPRVRHCFEADGLDWHANAAETSLMLALAPELVRAEKLKTSDDSDRTAELVFAHPVSHTSANGVTGSPSLGTIAQGEELYAWMVEDLVALIRRAQSEVPPLRP